MLRGWPSAKHASESRFNPLNLERILWLRKRRRRKRRRRRRRPRSRRSEFRPGWSAFAPPGHRATKRFENGGLTARLFDFGASSSPGIDVQRTASLPLAYDRAIQYSRGIHCRVPSHCRRGVLDAPPSRRMTIEIYLSANASRAPSMANPAAKLRRSQLTTLGLLTTRSRTDAANRP